MEDGLFIKGGHQPPWTKSIKAHKKNTVVVEAKPGFTGDTPLVPSYSLEGRFSVSLCLVRTCTVEMTS